MASHPGRPVALGTAGAGQLLLLAAPTPPAAVRTLREAGTAGDETAPLVALVALLAWVLAAWLTATVLLTAGAHLPGVAGRMVDPVARRLVPAAVRRTVEVALGLTVAAGVLAATPASASPGTDTGQGRGGDATAATSLDWGARDPGASADVSEIPPGGAPLDWPAPPAPVIAPPAPVFAPPTPATAAPTDAPPAADIPAAETGPVVVQPGDSLWELAEHDLAARGATPPSNAEIAHAWPAWWAANRDVVGDDPDLLHPGTRLTPPLASS